MELKVGDVVCLKSDKFMQSVQPMVISEIEGEDCWCTWMKDGEVKTYNFASITLMRYDEAYRDTTMELV